MVDTDVKFTRMDLLDHTKYRAFTGRTEVIVVVFCKVGKALKNAALPDESVRTIVDKNKYFAGGRSLLADIVGDATKTLFDAVTKKYPELIR